MPTEITIPALDPAMEKARVIKWHKKKGDIVNQGDTIAEIETDKAVFEVPSESSGVLGAPLVAEGEYTSVNSVIAVVFEKGESQVTPVKYNQNDYKDLYNVQPPPDSDSATSANQSAKKKSKFFKDRIFSSPLARRLAVSQGIDLSNISGSGPHGRIVRCDIERAVAVASEKGPLSTEATVLSASKSDLSFLPNYEEIKHSKMREIIARRLTESSRTIPHYFVNIDCELDKLLALRKELNESCSDIQKITINDLLIRAAAITLKHVPGVNVAWTEAAVLQFSQADISFAVAVPEGLITPVIRNADCKNLLLISSETHALVEKARKGKLLPSEYKGGTFSISNLGMSGVKGFTSIINPPQSAILSVGAAEQRPVVKHGQITIATVMSLTLAVDHRCIDGVVAAEFMTSFKKIVEAPLKILLQEQTNG